MDKHKKSDEEVKRELAQLTEEIEFRREQAREQGRSFSALSGSGGRGRLERREHDRVRDRDVGGAGEFVRRSPLSRPPFKTVAWPRTAFVKPGFLEFRSKCLRRTVDWFQIGSNPRQCTATYTHASRS